MVSQLIRQVRDLLQIDRQRWLPLATLIRNTHVNLVDSLLEPGGRGVLITDVASTKDTNELWEIDPREPAAIDLAAHQMIREEHFFAALTPNEMKIAMPHATGVVISPFWLWDINRFARYLCYGAAWQLQKVVNNDRAEVNLTDRLNEFMSRTGVAITLAPDQR